MADHHSMETRPEDMLLSNSFSATALVFLLLLKTFLLSFAILKLNATLRWLFLRLILAWSRSLLLLLLLLGLLLHALPHVEVLRCQGEYLFYVVASHSRGFKVFGDVVLLAEFEGSLFLYLSVVFEVRFAADQVDYNVCCCMLSYVTQPHLQVPECVFSGNIIAKEHDLCSLVENPCDTPERLLPSSVPNLQLDYLLIYLDNECPELHANSDLMLQLELIIHHSRKQTTLANAYTNQS